MTSMMLEPELERKRASSAQPRLQTETDDREYEGGADRAAQGVRERLEGGAKRGRPKKSDKSKNNTKPKAAQKPAPQPDDIATKWRELSTLLHKDGSEVSRSTALQKVDAAVATWVAGGMRAPDDFATNLAELDDVVKALGERQQQKKRAPGRENAIAALTNYVTTCITALDQRQAAALYDRFQLMDAETGKFARRNRTDIKPDRFERDRQSPGLMGLSEKNDDGTLTDKGLDALDDYGRDQARQLQEKARALTVTVDPTITTKKLRSLAKEEKNSLSKRTKYPELENITDPNKKPGGEVTETIKGMNVTYDKSDVHAAERLKALQDALKLVAAAGLTVPTLEVYFPKYGRGITVGHDCTIIPGPGIPDAIFYAPNFLSVSSANTGNPKDTTQFDGDLQFLSARLGANKALVHSIVHELGHTMHYMNDRGRFHNLGFTSWGKGPGGRPAQDIALNEVSQYAANNPRELVAEMFLGAVTGKKKFGADAWEMYDAFGGAPVKR